MGVAATQRRGRPGVLPAHPKVGQEGLLKIPLYDKNSVHDHASKYRILKRCKQISRCLTSSRRLMTVYVFDFVVKWAMFNPLQPESVRISKPHIKQTLKRTPRACVLWTHLKVLHRKCVHRPHSVFTTCTVSRYGSADTHRHSPTCTAPCTLRLGFRRQSILCCTAAPLLRCRGRGGSVSSN